MSKSFTAVVSPHKFIPAIIEDDKDFEYHWDTNKPWVFSNLSHIAYFQKKEAISFLQKMGADKTFFYNTNGAQAFLSVWNNKAILSFRGTQPIEASSKHHNKLGFFRKLRLKYFWRLPLDPLSLIYLNNDILADLKFMPTSFDGLEYVEVHSGFFGELNKLWNNIIQDINQHAQDIPIWVTGHSLGGAMATLAGMRHSFEKVITFGEPRVGINLDKTFKSKNHTRYVNGDDLVTKLPPEIMFGYDHHGEAVNITDSDGGTDIRYDHSIVYYSENLY